MPPTLLDSDDSDDEDMPALVSRQGGPGDDDSSDDDSDDDSSSMPGLLGRSNLHDDNSSQEENGNNNSDDDESIPQLITNRQNNTNDDDDSSDDESLDEKPPLDHREQGARANKKQKKAPVVESDSDSDYGDLPGLVQRKGGSDEDDSSSGDEEKPFANDDSDDSIPGLVSRRQAPRVDDDDDDSSGDDEMPGLVQHHSNRGGHGDDDSSGDEDYGTNMNKRINAMRRLTGDDDSSDDDDGYAGRKKNKSTKGKKNKKTDADERKAHLASKDREYEQVRRIQKQLEEQAKLQAEEARKREEEEKKRLKKQKEAEKKKKQKTRKKIFAFVKTQWLRRQAQKEYRAMKEVASFGQRFFRGKQVRKVWADKLRRRLILAKQYNKVWESSKKLIEAYTKRKSMKRKRQEDQFKSWASCLESLDFVVSEDTNDETAKILNDAADKAVRVEEAKEEDEYDDDDDEEDQVQDDTDYDAQMDAATDGNTTEEEDKKDEEPAASVVGEFTGKHTNIMYTENVKKWLRGPAGGRYRDLFVKRMKQLSRGERSRILAKRLKGSSKAVTVFETYLEQKSGKRILWQIEGNNLLVWFVANHDNVSRLMKLIEDSQDRKSRRLTSGDDLIKDQDSLAARRSTIEREAILNPLGNTPMKVYEVSLEDVNELASTSWVPKLRLTREERDVVETSGTVLLLGRSGTGKTICTANRMDYDREQMKHDSSFTQLFVARSQKLCAYVENVIGTRAGTTFETYDKLKQRLERELPTKKDIRATFPSELKMRFDVFKREVYNGGQEIDPLLAWTSIRSFIKGSIEATLKTTLPKAISEEEFLDLTVFSSGRCSLTVDQRKIVYPIYERYVRFLNDKNMWDDCDRILALLLRLEHCKVIDPEKYRDIQVSKIYVDEVQDYTQAECLLFFYLCDGQGNLFLAGDPAQNVVQGVEFRFQDIRSVEYHIAKDNNTVMQKPKKVHVNFRSHAGILNIAGSVLTCMFKAFPKSAENLGEDHGVFVGPRPGVFEKVQTKVLADLLANKMNGTVVLVHDSTLEKWTKALNYPLIRTIRESKGLEYKSVIILDFFGDLCDQVDEGVQKAWRGLLLRGEVEGLSSKFPEIETHLKLLYTGITRCIEQLFFVETIETIPGRAFVRWLTTTTTQWAKDKVNEEKEEVIEALATKNKVLDVQARVMTKDEALQTGIQFAAAAEAEGRSDVVASKKLLDQAIYYFDLADEVTYKKKAQVHLESIEIRSNLPPLPSKSEEEKEDDVAYAQYRDLESNVAKTVGKLLDEGLLMEGRDLCSCLVPYVPKWTKQHLKDEIVGPLE